VDEVKKIDPDEQTRLELIENFKEGVKSVGEGMKDVGKGIEALGDVARDNRTEFKWYMKLALVFMIGMGLLFVGTILRSPESFSREHICMEKGYTTKFTVTQQALDFIELYPDATCEFKTQTEEGWLGFFKNKIGLEKNHRLDEGGPEQ
jgi:hypothetical protein